MLHKETLSQKEKKNGLQQKEETTNLFSLQNDRQWKLSGEKWNDCYIGKKKTNTKIIDNSSLPK